MGITAGCSMKRRSFESGGARLILNLDQKEKKGRKKKPTKSKNKKTQTNKPAKSPIFKIRERGWGVITLILMLFFVLNLKLFYMLPKWWEELLQYLMFYM